MNYTLTDDAGGRFAINTNTGIVSVLNGALINDVTAPNHQYSITVKATDSFGAMTSASFLIGVSDVPPTTPIDSDPTPNSVPEGAASGTTVGIAAARPISTR